MCLIVCVALALCKTGKGLFVTLYFSVYVYGFSWQDLRVAVGTHLHECECRECIYLYDSILWTISLSMSVYVCLRARLHKCAFLM